MARNEVQIRKNAAKLFSEWRNDWNKFISEALGVTLDEEQQAIVTAVQHKKLVSVRSGTARGKDFVAACIAVCFLYLTPKWRKNPNGKWNLSRTRKLLSPLQPTDK